MAAAHHAAPRQQHQYSIPPPPPPAGLMNDALRLPSIKDLQFSFERPRTEGSQNSSGNGAQTMTEISVSAGQDRSRSHSQSWSRSVQPTPPAHPPQQQHTPPLSAGLEPKSSDYPTRHDSGGYLTPGLPLSAQTTPLPGSVSIGPAVRNDDKRSRPSPIVASRDSRPNHVVYPPQYQSYQPPMPPPSPYHQMSPVLAAPTSINHTPLPPSPHAHIQQQPSAPPAHPGYTYQPQQPQPYMARSSPQHVGPPPPHNYHPAPQQVQAPLPSSQPPTVPYPSPSPSVSQEPPHWEHLHHQPVQPVQHHQVQHAPPPPPPTTAAPASLTTVHHNSYSHPPPPPPPTQQQPPPHSHPMYSQSSSLSRAIPPVVTTPIVPTPEVEIRTPYTANPAKPSERENTMSEIVKLCSILYDFASRYSTLSSAMPHIQPTITEVSEMARRANEVVQLLDLLRRLDDPDGAERFKDESTPGAMPTTPEDHRPPKRPWEDMAQDGQVAGDDTSNNYPEPPSGSGGSEQTTAEQDMELIRSKRATTTAGAASAAGQPKSKYRKRSRATPPGKCHSCNIRETPEWRRGPDGARTLCNACGLHYAKLVRKQSKQNPPNGEALPKIDMDTLKASAKAAELEKSGGGHSLGKTDENTAPHQGQFQVSVLSPAEAQAQGQTSTATSSSSDPSRLPAHHHTILPPPTTTTTTGGSMPPPPPWAANARTYTPSEQFQGQSFIRSVNR